MFDEADLDGALTRFDELQPQPPRLQNAASQAYERLTGYFTAGDWASMSNVLAHNMLDDDRRRMVNAGIRWGRDIQIANGQAVAQVGADRLKSTVIATRGRRLALCRSSIFGRDEQPGAFRIEFLSVIEIDVNEQLVAHVAFDLDNFEAALAELDARYLAGEAAPYAHVWSIVLGAYAAANRHEMPLTAPGWINIDHRRARAFTLGDLGPYLRATWDLVAPDMTVYVEVVHRLSALGAVVTHVAKGTSREGFDAEWREITLTTVEANLIDRSEMFDEADLDVALTRFEELHEQTRRLENLAIKADQRFWVCFAGHDWHAMAELLADDISTIDRRRIVNAGTLHGRGVHVENMRAVAEWAEPGDITSVSIATRGERLALTRIRSANHDLSRAEYSAELLYLIEVDAEQRIVRGVFFDPDDIDAAFTELDARYIAGEAAAHAHTWSVIARSYSESNRRELPGMTADSVYIDHRAVLTAEREDLAGYLPSVWELMPDIRAHIEAVHRLTDLGAVITQAARGTSQEGFDAEWRVILVGIVEGDLVSRVEIFDEADLDAALARLEELQPQAPRLENAASRVFGRFSTHWVAREWDSATEMLADDIFNDDRRRVVSAGVRHGRDATVASMRASAGFGLSAVTSTVIATRGERLALSRDGFSIRDQGPEEVIAEVLGIVEICADERIVARLAFDLDDFDAAIAELDARYLVGEAAPYASTWSVIARADTATQPARGVAYDAGLCDHRPPAAREAGRGGPDRLPRRLVGPHPGPSGVRRVGTSAERTRGSRHPRLAGDLARRF